MTDAMYHRTLSLAADNHGRVPNCYGSEKCPRIRRLQAYFLTDVLNNTLTPVLMNTKPDQDFAKYATEFEKNFSTLILGGARTMFPIVDDNNAEVQSGANTWPDQEVIAHLGFVGGSYVHVPKGTNVNSKISSLLADNIPVLVAATCPSGYVSYATEAKFRLGTDIDGRVLWYLDFDVAGLESSSTTKAAGVAGARKAAGVSTGQILKSAVKQILRGLPI